MTILQFLTTNTIILSNQQIAWSVVAFLLIAIVVLAWFLWKLAQDKKNQSTSDLASNQIHQLEEKLKTLEKKIKSKEIQIRQKTIEIAKQSKENKDKDRLIINLYDKVIDMDQNSSVFKIKKNQMKRLLENYLQTETNTFEVQIDELNQAFFKQLKEQYPKLSVYDLRLSAYLKMGLNSKEIAEIMQVLPSSINVSRSRLRKKLDLKPDDDLFEFMNQIQ